MTTVKSRFNVSKVSFNVVAWQFDADAWQVTRKRRLRRITTVLADRRMKYWEWESCRRYRCCVCWLRTTSVTARPPYICVWHCLSAIRSIFCFVSWLSTKMDPLIHKGDQGAVESFTLRTCTKEGVHWPIGQNYVGHRFLGFTRWNLHRLLEQVARSGFWSQELYYAELLRWITFEDLKHFRYFRLQNITRRADIWVEYGGYNRHGGQFRRRFLFSFCKLSVNRTVLLGDFFCCRHRTHIV